MNPTSQREGAPSEESLPSSGTGLDLVCCLSVFNNSICVVLVLLEEALSALPVLERCCCFVRDWIWWCWSASRLWLCTRADALRPFCTRGSITLPDLWEPTCVCEERTWPDDLWQSRACLQCWMRENWLLPPEKMSCPDSSSSCKEGYRTRCETSSWSTEKIWEKEDWKQALPPFGLHTQVEKNWNACISLMFCCFSKGLWIGKHFLWSWQRMLFVWEAKSSAIQTQKLSQRAIGLFSTVPVCKQTEWQSSLEGNKSQVIRFCCSLLLLFILLFLSLFILLFY